VRSLLSYITLRICSARYLTSSIKSGDFAKNQPSCYGQKTTPCVIFLSYTICLKNNAVIYRVNDSTSTVGTQSYPRYKDTHDKNGQFYRLNYT